MKAEFFLERISKKPEKRVSNHDVMICILHDIDLKLERQIELLEKLTSEIPDKNRVSSTWWNKIFS